MPDQNEKCKFLWAWREKTGWKLHPDLFYSCNCPNWDYYNPIKPVCINKDYIWLPSQQTHASFALAVKTLFHGRQNVTLITVVFYLLFPTLAWSSISASDSSSQRSKSGAKNRGFFSCSVSRSHQRSSCFLILMSTWRWVDLWLIWKQSIRKCIWGCFFLFFLTLTQKEMTKCEYSCGTVCSFVPEKKTRRNCAAVMIKLWIFHLNSKREIIWNVLLCRSLYWQNMLKTREIKWLVFIAF